MSSNPTQPKFSDQGEGVNFPPEDDAEGHRFAAMADADQPEGFRAAAFPEGDEDDTEGHRKLVLADSDDDTEGHAAGFVDGRPAGQPEAMEPVPSKEGFRALADGEDTEGHRLSYYADGGKPSDGPEGFAPLRAQDAEEDDTEGHLRVLADGDGKDGFASL